uniref:Uncharacterized protein n=1 Tax=Caenorhabditis japonica TaxID=281687 RepID=A0A8R1EAT4_CAEJA
MPVDWLKIKNRDVLTFPACFLDQNLMDNISELFLVSFTIKKNNYSRLLHSKTPFFISRVSWSRNSKTTLTKTSQAYLILCPTVIMEL